MPLGYQTLNPKPLAANALSASSAARDWRFPRLSLQAFQHEEPPKTDGRLGFELYVHPKLETLNPRAHQQKAFLSLPRRVVTLQDPSRTGVLAEPNPKPQTLNPNSTP